MSEFYAYAHLRPDFTPFYIGKGSGRRAYDFINGRSKHHKNIVAKHGRENIIVEMMPCGSEIEAFLREQLAIKAIRAAGVALCNQSDGGEGATGAVRTQEFKDKLAARTRGKRYTLGRKHTPEAIAKLILANLGNKYNLGKKRSAESRAKMSEIMRGKNTQKGRKHSKEIRERMRIAALEREKKKRERRGE